MWWQQCKVKMVFSASICMVTQNILTFEIRSVSHVAVTEEDFELKITSPFFNHGSVEQSA